MKKQITKIRVSLMTLFLMFGCLVASAQGLVTINLKNATLQELFSAIERQSDVRFSYRNVVLDKQANITINQSNASVTSVLGAALAGKNLSYEQVSPKSIVITDKAVAQNSSAQAADGKLTIAVSDEQGTPIAGAMAIVRGTSVAAVSDANGLISIVAKPGSLIDVSFIGFEKQNITVGSAQKYSVTLKDDVVNIDQVVVVGYGTQKKVNLTGSVSTISTEDVTGRVQNNLISSVQGAVPGVTVITRPGGATTVNFRGRGNLGSSDPLYVIDGAISTASFFNSLDPNSIETISFLKDAASSSIYGSRAAYGVVLVTTKKGKSDRMVVNYNGYFGMNTPTYTPDVVHSYEYAELLNEGMWNRDQTKSKFQAYTPDQIELFRNGSQPDLYPDSRWYEEALVQWVPTTRHTVDFSGGSEKLRYFAGVGYLYNQNQGFVQGRNNSRYNVDISLTSDIKKWLTLRGGVKYIKSINDYKGGSPTLSRMSSLPGIMVGRHSDGTLGTVAGGKQAPQTFYQDNPFRAMDRQNWGNGSSDNTMIDLGLDFKPVKGLIIRTSAVYTGAETKNKSYSALQDELTDFITKEKIPGSGQYTNKMDMNWGSSYRMMYTGTATYDWSDANNAITILGGVSYEDSRAQNLSGSRKNFPIDGLEDMNAGSNAPSDITNGAGSSQNKMMSYFGRLNYSYGNRYLLEANIRADASSRFHPDNRWGIFPSFSAGWRIDQEAFMQDVTWISNLKLRASWGQLGNINNVGNYDYFQNYQANSDYVFDGEPVKGISESRPANSTLGWETVTQTNVGLDLDFWGGKLGMTAEWYYKQTDDILMAYNVPAETGIGVAPSQNIGKVLNQGVELLLSHRNTVGEFSYSITVNGAYNVNRILDLGGSDNMIFNGGDKIRQINRVGEAIGSYYGLTSGGRLYTQDEIDRGEYYKLGRVPKAGDIRYNVLREAVEWGSNIDQGFDRDIIGNNMPNFTYGVNLQLNYKGFELSVFGQGVAGATVALEVDQVTPFAMSNNPKSAVLGRWTAENPNPYAVWPRIYGGHSLDNYNWEFSDWNLFSADYFRIKTITLGYSLPRNLMQNWKMNNIKFYVTGENLFTILGDKRMRDFDPEENTGRGLSALGVKSLAFGVNISF